MINFNATREEIDLIVRIANRAEASIAQVREMNRTERGAFRRTLLMDLEACNATTPLNLQVLLDFPQFDFAHDIVGIYNHMNRDTGKLDGIFSPRCERRYHPETTYRTTMVTV